MSRASAVIDSGILVFHEGLETIFVLAAVTASFLGANRGYRRPVAVGGRVGLLATVGTWFPAIWIIGLFGGRGLAAAGRHRAPGDHRPAGRHELVLSPRLLDRLDIAPPPAQAGAASRRGSRSLCGASPGFGLLGFTSIYREGFEIVIFLQNLRVSVSAGVVLEGVLARALFTAGAGC